MNSTIAGRDYDWDFLQKTISKLLLLDVWANTATQQFRADVFDSLLRPGYLLDPKNPPIVGVGLAGPTVEPGERRLQLEFLCTVPEEELTVDRFLRSRGLPPDVPSHATRTGRIVAPASPHLGARRSQPAQGGDSIGHQAGKTGTIGCLVEDTGPSGQSYLLSCNHVLAALNREVKGKAEIWQPGPGDGGSSANRIGILENFIPINFGGQANNRVDAALCRPDNLIDVQRGIRELGQLRGYDPSPPLNTLVGKCGWKTGLTRGVFAMKIGGLLVTYDDGQMALFEGQLGMLGTQRGQFFAEAGDSGAIILKEENNAAIGMLFAVAVEANAAFANPIEPVLTGLHVKLV